MGLEPAHPIPAGNHSPRFAADVSATALEAAPLYRDMAGAEE